MFGWLKKKGKISHGVEEDPDTLRTTVAHVLGEYHSGFAIGGMHSLRDLVVRLSAYSERHEEDALTLFLFFFSYSFLLYAEDAQRLLAARDVSSMLAVGQSLHQSILRVLRFATLHPDSVKAAFELLKVKEEPPPTTHLVAYNVDALMRMYDALWRACDPFPDEHTSPLDRKAVYGEPFDASGKPTFASREDSLRNMLTAQGHVIGGW